MSKTTKNISLKSNLAALRVYPMAATKRSIENLKTVAMVFDKRECGFRPCRSAIPVDADHPFRQVDHPGRDAAG